MRPCFVDTGDQQTHAVGTPAVGLCVDLGFVGDGIDHTGDGDGAGVDEAGGHRLLPHEIGEDAGVGG